jgi:hypothetical protein
MSPGEDPLDDSKFRRLVDLRLAASWHAKLKVMNGEGVRHSLFRREPTLASVVTSRLRHTQSLPDCQGRAHREKDPTSLEIRISPDLAETIHAYFA